MTNRLKQTIAPLLVTIAFAIAGATTGCAAQIDGQAAAAQSTPSTQTTTQAAENAVGARPAGIPAEYTTDSGRGAWVYWDAREVGESCRDSWHDRCWTLRVYMTRSCDLFYVQINVLDANKQVIDWTNDTLHAMTPGDTGALYFGSMNKQAVYARVTEVVCA